MTNFVKDPGATLDYGWDWSEWLSDTEVISSASVTVPAPLTRTRPDSVTSPYVIVWISGGDVGSAYTCTCHITTSEGRVDERTHVIRIRER